MVKESLRMGKTVLQFLDNGIFFSEGFLIILFMEIVGLLKALN